MNAEQVRAEIERLKRESVEARLALIGRELPEVLCDARHFVEGTKACPWEFTVAFVDGEFRAIQEKYGIEFRSHRPAGPGVPPRTAVFYEACQLLAIRLAGEQP